MKTKGAVKKCNSREKWHVSLTFLIMSNVDGFFFAIALFLFAHEIPCLPFFRSESQFGEKEKEEPPKDRQYSQGFWCVLFLRSNVCAFFFCFDKIWRIVSKNVCSPVKIYPSIGAKKCEEKKRKRPQQSDISHTKSEQELEREATTKMEKYSQKKTSWLRYYGFATVRKKSDCIVCGWGMNKHKKSTVATQWPNDSIQIINEKHERVPYSIACARFRHHHHRFRFIIY